MRPYIIFDDAPLEQAVDGLIASKFRNAGQTCVCANRAFVQRGVYDQVVRCSPRRSTAAGWARATAGGRDRAADRRAGAGQGRRARPGRRRARRAPDGRRRAPDRRRLRRRRLLRADGARRRDARDADLARGDLRPRRGARAVRHRGRGDRARQRHGVRARGVLPHAATTRACSGWPRSSSTASSAPTAGSSARRTSPSAASRSPATAARAASSGIDEYLDVKYVLVGDVASLYPRDRLKPSRVTELQKDRHVVGVVAGLEALA